jgi:hypothetical protein
MNYPHDSLLCNFQIVDKYRYLGILLDCSLTLRDLLAALRQKLRNLTRMAFKFHLASCSLQMRLQIFKVYAYPHIHYGIEIWTLEKFATKLAKQLCPLFFSSLKTFLGIGRTINNHRVLLCFGLTHPVFVSMQRFLKSSIILMKQHNNRGEFAAQLPVVTQSLQKCEQQLGTTVAVFRGSSAA